VPESQPSETHPKSQGPLEREPQLELLRNLADSVSDFIGICDLEMRPHYINHSGLMKIGLEPAMDLNKVTVRDFFFEEDQANIVNEFFPQVLRDGFGEIEVRFRHFRTGEPLWMLYQVTLLRNAEGVPIGYGTISRDITRHKLFEKAILESEERFRHLADQAPMFIWMIDENAKITYANRELLNFLDIRHFNEVAVQGGWERVTHPDDIQRVFAAFMTGLTNREPYTVEARLFNASQNHYQWFLFKATPRFISEYAFAGFIGTAVNIHEQKLMIEAREDLVQERTRELQLSNSLLERSNQELEQFAYVASHDLQEPLRKIQLFTQIIEEKYSETVSSEVQNYLTRISRSASTMSELIRSLLDISRLSHSRDSSLTFVDLNLVVENVVSDFELAIQEKHIVIEKQDLPVIEGVQVQLTQLFNNLIGNAIKFSRSDTASFIKISSKVVTKNELSQNELKGSPDQYALISIEDNGIGFSPNYSEKIFGIFQRLNDRKSYSGYGIGLALCRRIVEGHGGTITGSGRENEGATFNIILPRKQSKTA
jgi:PAS domain S-box-containing protein